MIDLPWPTLVGIGLIVTMAYTVFGLGGFGANIVGLPLLVHWLPLRFAVPMMLVFDLCVAAVLGYRARRLLDRHELLRLMPLLLVGMVAGVTLLSQADERWLLLVLGLFVLSYAAWSLLNKVPPAPVSPMWAMPAGLVGGVFTALYGTGGPIYTIYLARRLADKSVLRATIGVLVFSTATIRLLLFTGGGFYAQRGLLPLAAGLLPCALLGYLIGSRLHHRLSGARAVQAVWLLLIGSGASLVWRSLSGS